MVNHPIISAKEETVRNSGFNLGKELGQSQDGQYYAVIYERGILMRPYFTGRTYFFEIKTSLLGKPMILNPDDAGRKIITAFVPKTDIPGISTPISKDLNGLVSVLQNKLVLSPVSKDVANNTGQLAPVNSIWNYRNMVICFVAFNDRPKLKHRQLYDLSFAQSETEINAIAPHSVYVNNSVWSDFGFIHVTDIHVARRIDENQQKLEQLARTDSKIKPELYNNNNDRFRDFIRHANKLHDEGKVDCILATGDLIDYIYEKDDDKTGGGNFEFFRDIILGKGTSPSGTPNEELRVPIFTTLGNHDYRSNPYPLVGSVKAKLSDVIKDIDENFVTDILGKISDVITLGASKEVYSINQYAGFNMTEYEALAVEGNIKDGKYVRPELNKDEGADQVRVDKKMVDGTSYYHQYINPVGSFTVSLGDKHKIVMLDTKYDSGVTSNIWKIVGAYIVNNHDVKKFVNGYVNAEGFNEHDYGLVRSSLQNGKDGIVVLGMHAPPLNHKQSEYSHFFRETEHETADPLNTIDFLIRHAGIPFEIQEGKLYRIFYDTNGNKRRSLAKPSDISTNMSLSGTKYFMKSEKIEDILGRGTANGKTELLKICAGATNQTEKVDLILCGHKHRNVEYSVKWNATDEKLQLYHDYYSENPYTYYTSRDYRYKSDDDEAKKIFVKTRNILSPSNVEYYSKNTQENRPFDHYSQDIPTFKQSLDDSADPKEWWNKYRPLVTQTTSLGPTSPNQRRDHDGQNEYPDPTFQGFRLIKVENDIITKINHVKIQEDVREIPRPDNTGPPSSF